MMRNGGKCPGWSLNRFWGSEGARVLGVACPGGTCPGAGTSVLPSWQWKWRRYCLFWNQDTVKTEDEYVIAMKQNGKNMYNLI